MTKTKQVAPVSPSKPDQLVDVEDNASPFAAADAEAADKPAAGLVTMQMGATMQGFQIADDSSEEDIDAIPEEM